jgi:selenocysteine lyase/cysteine desulfurase
MSALRPIALPRRIGRDTIVYTEADFPSMGFVLAMAGRAGFRLRCIADTADFAGLDCWDSVLDEDCCLALVTHVHSNTSRQVPVRDICELARGRDVITVVDVAQSAHRRRRLGRRLHRRFLRQVSLRRPGRGLPVGE